MSKKGAMFGIDARITLAIFGTLGLGAATFFLKKIDSSNATRYLSEMKSLETAYINFKNDTRYDLERYASNTYFYDISMLVNVTEDSNIPYTKKYDGPYINYNLTGSNNILKHPILGNNVAIISRSYSNDWLGATKTAKCPETDCFKWIVFYDIPTPLANRIDVSVDGSVTPNTGKIRLEDNGDNKDIFKAIESE